MAWNLDFISEEDFKKHVRATIMKYGEKLESYDLKRFNSNLIDPIKLIFDKSVYRTSWEEIVNNEIFRQRDKSNNNDIGYFHQNIFSYFKGCEVPQAGWDVIYKNPEGIQMPDGDIVHTIYVEMKNKHNTMNSASSAKTYIKMQGQILEDDDCACLLVEAIAKKSQNIKWSTKVDGKNVQRSCPSSSFGSEHPHRQNGMRAWCRRSETLSGDVPTITYPYGPVKTKPRPGMIRDGA